ncbi:MAG: glycosyltransferase family 39 protein [Deltaproteobacteria bacterium]|nr:glycosyltransferase family 39 protein [Deltaproteobacteria bacterium]
MSAERAAPIAALLACVLCLLALSLQDDPLSPQSLANQYFAATPRYTTALSELNRVWPPLYPSTLWGLTAVGVPLGQVNALLLLTTLSLLFFAGRRVAPGVDPAWGVALYAACAFNAFNLHQLVSEALLIPLALGTLVLTCRCASTAGVRDHVLLSALLAACCLTRYFALVWLVPVVGLALLATRPRAHRVWRAAAVTVGAMLPLGAWMLHARISTGYLTGMERFSPRIFSEKTTLLENLSFGGRTLFLDGFTPGANASHASVGVDWSLDPIGIAVAAGAVALALWCTRVAVAARAAGRAASTNDSAGVAWVLLPGLSLGYLAVLLTVWTLGNNDPLYGRFLFPCYVFFMLAGMHLYAGVKRTAIVARRPFQLLYALMLASQSIGTIGVVAQALGDAS